ncbi:MAG: hypothetical protein WC956_04760 [bacterium]
MIVKRIGVLFKGKYYKYAARLGAPSNARIVLGDVFGRRYREFENHAHLQCAMEWLCRAQDITIDGGVSAGYSILHGWQPSHRETTGYIIPTFFDYARYSGDRSYSDRALRMAGWELSVQLKNGAIPYGAEVGNLEPLVFDTGQVIFGWLRAYEETGNVEYLGAAKNAGKWLCSVMDKDGCWRQHVFNGVPHAYNTRVSWALLELFRLSGENMYRDAAIRNIEWTLDNQLKNGWFRYCAFLENENPITHTIAYTIRGILESGLALDSNQYIARATVAADALLNEQKSDGSLRGVYDSDWQSTVRWSCLTGNAQMSIIWLTLYQLTKETRYLEAARLANRYLRGMQNINARNANIRGAISGSYPIWGGYNPFAYQNWMTKFFVDALLLEEKAVASPNHS